MRATLGTHALRIDRATRAVNYVVVDAVLGILESVVETKHPPRIRFVFAEEQLGRALVKETPLPILRLVELDYTSACRPEAGFFCVRAPRPGVAKPDGGQQMNLGRLRGAIRHR